MIKFLPLFWLALWLPLSFCFQQNPHFPSGIVAPLMGFIAVLRNGWHGNVFYEITLPWMIFWLGMASTIAITVYLNKTKI